MANKYIGDLMFSTGEYEVNGEKKKRWTKAGAAFQDPETHRISIKFEAFPAGPDWSGFMTIMPPRDKEPKPMTQAQALNGGKDFAPTEIDDKPIDLSEIPF